MIRLSYQDASDLAELVSHMESATLPKGHTATLTVIDAVGRPYASIVVRDGEETALMIAPMSSVGAGADIQDTPVDR